MLHIQCVHTPCATLLVKECWNIWHRAMLCDVGPVFLLDEINVLFSIRQLQTFGYCCWLMMVQDFFVCPEESFCFWFLKNFVGFNNVEAFSHISKPSMQQMLSRLGNHLARACFSNCAMCCCACTCMFFDFSFFNFKGSMPRILIRMTFWCSHITYSLNVQAVQCKTSLTHARCWTKFPNSDHSLVLKTKICTRFWTTPRFLATQFFAWYTAPIVWLTLCIYGTVNISVMWIEKQLLTFTFLET